MSATTDHPVIPLAPSDWQVFPVHSVNGSGCTCGRPDCPSPAKHPRTGRGLYDATDDPAAIEKWREKWPGCNWGLPTGATSGLVVVDEDPDHGGRESRQRMEEKYGPLPVTPTVRTGGGGFHYFYRHPGTKLSNAQPINTEFPGIDLRGDGGYVVGAGGSHLSGGTYEWVEGRSPADIEFADLPQWIIDLRNQRQAPREPSRSTATNGDSRSELIRAVRQYAAKAEPVGEGQRNATAFRLAGQLAAFTHEETGETPSEADILGELRAWNQYNTPPLPEGELETTIRSAITNGTPREPKVVKGKRRGAGVKTLTANATASGDAVETVPKFLETASHAGPDGTLGDSQPDKGEGAVFPNGKGVQNRTGGKNLPPEAGLEAGGEAPHVDDSSNRPKPEVLLPGNEMTITESARKLGELLAETGQYYTRGGAVVQLDRDDDGAAIIRPVKASSLPAALESVARLKKQKATKSGDFIEVAATCSEGNARLIMGAQDFLDALPTIKVLSDCPVITEHDGELAVVVGYDPHTGILASGEQPPDLSLDEATAALSGLLCDFNFASDGDYARALAAIITPALVFGGLLPGRAPIDLGEADESQSGKGYRNKLTAAIYCQKVRTIAQRKGGVGSLEESLNSALVRGANFIAFDNVRGQLDSPATESLLTEDRYSARVPYQPDVEIDPRRVVVMLTSNRAEITSDLANRAACVRILKQGDGYQYQTYPEGDVLEHVRANQGYYLGAVFAVARAWHEAGKPCNRHETRHDFRGWAQVMDWITRELLGAGPLLDGHRETQLRMATPALNWLRDAALAVKKTGRLGRWIRTHDLVRALSEVGVDIPGVGDADDLTTDEGWSKATKGVGRKLAQCLTGDEATIDGFTIRRRETTDEQYRPCKEYVFEAESTKGPGTAPATTSSYPAIPRHDPAISDTNGGAGLNGDTQVIYENATPPYRHEEGKSCTHDPNDLKYISWGTMAGMAGNGGVGPSMAGCDEEPEPDPPRATGSNPSGWPPEALEEYENRVAELVMSGWKRDHAERSARGPGEATPRSQRWRWHTMRTANQDRTTRCPRCGRYSRRIFIRGVEHCGKCREMVSHPGDDDPQGAPPPARDAEGVVR